MNWPTLISNGVKFAIVRSSNGLYKNNTSSDGVGRDKMLLKNAAELTAENIPWAIYHYVQPIHDIEQQIALVVSILDELKSIGTSPRAGQFSDGTFLPRVFLDVEETAITNSQIKFFVDGLAAHGIGCGIYTRKNIWEPITEGVDVWWHNLMLWIAAYGANDGKIPNFVPDLPRGWSRAHIWQYTSLGGFEVGHTKDSLDVNVACLHLYPVKQPPVPPPPVNKIDLLPYLRGANGLQLDTDATSFTQTYNTQWFGDAWRLIKGGNKQYEYLYADSKYIYRREDTSQGNDIFYIHKTNGKQGAPWLNRFMAIGETSVFSKQVQHYWNNCSPRLPLANVTDSIKLVAKHSSYFFNKTGKTVNDVIELKWLEGGETYFFGKDKGLIGFKDPVIDSQFSGVLEGREPLLYNTPACVIDSEKAYLL